MNHFLSANDVADVNALVAEGLEIAATPRAWGDLGRGRTLGLIFMNPSLRTRLSTEKAGVNLGMHVMTMNAGADGWKLETRRGAVMDGDAQEHIVEAARVVSAYCDIVGLRTFAGLQDRAYDYDEVVLNTFAEESSAPLVNLESATVHPLQSLADMMTIRQRSRSERPRVVLSWAPHPRALPHAVPNSFAQWANACDLDLVITHPPDYELDPQFAGDAEIEYDQDRALDGAEFVYAKNWSSTEPYGTIRSDDRSWTITTEKMARTDGGLFMHCLPVRRNVIVTDEVIDSAASIVIPQAKNREYAAQAVLKRMLGVMEERS